MIKKIQHNFNALHVYCKMLRAGFPAGKARIIAGLYEKLFHSTIYTAKEDTAMEVDIIRDRHFDETELPLSKTSCPVSEKENSKTAVLTIEGKDYELPVLVGTEGEMAIDISELRQKTGMITLDPHSTNMFTVMFAIGRLPGWISQWKESLDDPKWRLQRPRQIYIGPGKRHYTELKFPKAV